MIINDHNHSSCIYYSITFVVNLGCTPTLKKVDSKMLCHVIPPSLLPILCQAIHLSCWVLHKWNDVMFIDVDETAWWAFSQNASHQKTMHDCIYILIFKSDHRAYHNCTTEARYLDNLSLNHSSIGKIIFIHIVSFF